MATAQNDVITREALLDHWQGHRRLTRKLIEAFPEDRLFEFSVGGMRPFSDLAKEMIDMAGPGIKGVATGEWQRMGDNGKKPANKKELLEQWDEATELINQYWPQIPAGRFAEMDKAFGQYEGPVYWVLFYFIDNEIHHRGQGYVYLRALGIEPPAFWDRS
jgi:uncharacterized damage-inducible protein DinB